MIFLMGVIFTCLNYDLCDSFDYYDSSKITVIKKIKKIIVQTMLKS